MKKLLISSLLSIAVFTTMGIGVNASTLSKPSTPLTSNDIQNKINSMSDEEKVGQLLILGLQGNEVDSKTQTLIKEKHAGGVILYGWRNFYNKTINENIKYVNDLKKVNKENSSIPLFISFDEEGGPLSYLPGELIKIPTKGEIGNFNDANLAEAMGECTGKKLNRLGINLDFGTILDINTNPKNPIIGVRSYGSTKERVSELGTREMIGIRSQKVIATMKHFPGHGDTSTDSHVNIPRIDHNIDRLKNMELVPFQKAIDNGCDMIMTAHILASKIDSENPATLSKKILTDILRKDMKYNGVIITDDLEMAAITKNYDIGEAAVKSFNAGADILLVCHTEENQNKVYNTLLKAVKDNKITKERLNESLNRILTLKTKYDLKDEDTAPLTPFSPEINNFVYERLQQYFKLVLAKMY